MSQSSTSEKKFKSLTPYPVGSVREVFRMATPLMLMAMSTYLMMFADRLVLSHYSVEAMNAVAMVSVMFAVFQFSTLSLALIAEVFVGQYNGAGKLDQVGRPVWQMIWFSLGTILIFWPVGIFLGKYLITETFHEYGLDYFFLVCLFGPCIPMAAALASFYVGRGHPWLVTGIVALCNVVNIVLDIILVFGIEGYIEPMGVKGAALATGIGFALQVLIFFPAFLRKKNAQKYNTRNYSFDWKLMKRCFNIGLPTTISYSLAILAWGIFFGMIGKQGKDYATTVVMMNNYFMLFVCTSEGIGKAVIALCSNLMGAKRQEFVPKVVFSAIKLVTVIALITFIPMVMFPWQFIDLFIDNQLVDGVDVTGLRSMIREAQVYNWFCISLCGFFFVYQSQLTSAGDTRFPMWMNVFCSWFLMLIPGYILIDRLHYSPELSWKLMVINIFAIVALLYVRYKKGKWREIEVIEK
jgi:MATE family multidrug resistance protein